MQTYLDLLRDVLTHGTRVPTRTIDSETRQPLAAISLFGRQCRYDLRAGFPAVTTKRLAFKSVKVELLWMLRGDTNLAFLHEHGVRIWDEWADANGDLGPLYGAQWRAWPGLSADKIEAIREYTSNIACTAEHPQAEGKYDVLRQRVRWMGDNAEAVDKILDGAKIDQIANLVAGIEAVKREPRASVGRRLILTAWNVAEIERMKLPPCHAFTQFLVRDGALSCHLYQRSADVFLGVPFNVAQYALLTHLLAHVTGLGVGEFVHSFGDVHLYENHVEKAQLQLARAPMALPRLWLNPTVTTLDGFGVDDIRLEEYASHPAIERGSVAV